MVTKTIFVPIFLYNLISIVLATKESDVLSTRRTIYNITEADSLFDSFLKVYNKTYNNTNEYRRRLKTFRENLEDINKLNSGDGSDVYGITMYSDMTTEEFLDKSGGKKWKVPKIDNFTENLTLKAGSRSKIPEFCDWSTSGTVSGVGNQGSCRSCWAYSAVGLLEGQYAIKHKKLVTLSAQQLIDCTEKGKGCNSMTFPHIAINLAAKQGGVMPDSEYRYLGFQAACRMDKSRAVAKIKTATRYIVRDESQLRRLVYNYGPVAAGFLISSGFPKYKRGVASAENFKCNVKGLLNHSVLIVGFGVYQGVHYWIIKNSHGTHWGDHGYFRLKGGDNPCNLLDYIATVTLQ